MKTIYFIWNKLLQEAVMLFPCVNEIMAARIFAYDVQERCKNMVHQPEDFELRHFSIELLNSSNLVDVEKILNIEEDKLPEVTDERKN